jgi:Phycobilisome degradation protein nblA
MLSYHNGFGGSDDLGGSDSDQASETNALSMSQMFQLELLRRQIEGLPLEDSHDYLFELFRQMMVKDNLVKDMFKSCYL